MLNPNLMAMSQNRMGRDSLGIFIGLKSYNH